MEDNTAIDTLNKHKRNDVRLQTVEKNVWSILRQIKDLRPALMIIFSILWAAIAFDKASSARRRKIQSLEKKLLLEQSAQENDEKKHMEIWKEGRLGQRKVVTNAEELSSAVGYSFHVFLFVLICHLSLLPVKFYTLAFSFLRNLLFQGNDNPGALLWGYSVGSFNGISFDFFTDEETNFCLGYAIFLRASSLFSVTVRSNIAAYTKTFRRRFVRFVLRRPIYRFRKLRMALRWAEYLAPLFIQNIKLGSNFQGIIKNVRQRFERKKIMKKRKRRLSLLTSEQREEKSAILIQAKFRSYHSRKLERVYRLVCMTEKEIAAFKIKSHMRTWAHRARTRVREKREEWHRLRLRESNNNDLNFEEKKKMYILEQQLQKEVKTKTSQSMLMRPNTRYAIAWKILFFVALLVELSHLTMEPKVRQYKNISKNEKLDVSTVMEYYLVPDHINAWPECAMYPKKQRYIGRRNKNSDETVKPWYCFTPYTTVHSFYIIFLKFMIGEALFASGVIFFIDVFIDFFTGDVCPQTGKLHPQHFFARWIIPGIVFQLLVNPWLEVLRVILRVVLGFVKYVGPDRLWCWSVVLIFPCMKAMFSWLKWNVYYELVAVQNQASCNATGSHNNSRCKSVQRFIKI